MCIRDRRARVRPPAPDALQNEPLPRRWKLCEVWRADAHGEPARVPSSGDLERLGLGLTSPTLTPEAPPRDLPVAAPTGVTRLTLACGATPRRGDCYSPMRSPRGHACPRCLEDPTASMLRCASNTSFSPGIGLVGRAWLLGVAEVVDLLAPTTEPSTYARLDTATASGLSTAVALPVTLPSGDATAVFVVYFGERLLHHTAYANAATTLADDALKAMVGRGRDAARRFGHPLSSASDIARALSGGKLDELADIDERVAFAGRRKGSDSSSSTSSCSKTSPKGGGSTCSDPTATAGDRHFARKLPHRRGSHRDSVHQCPVCYGTVERAATVAACAHSACAECLARWRLTSDRCPSCRGPIDAVEPNARLDREIADAAVRRPLRRSTLSF